MDDPLLVSKHSSRTIGERTSIRENTLVKKRWCRYSPLLWTLAFACLIASASTHAQDTTKPAIEKWRPRDGIYVHAGKHLVERCGDSTELFVELRERSVAGSEWNCKVERFTDIVPDTLRLDLTCNDYNLAQDIDNHDPNPYDKKFKEVNAPEARR
jgi:hypothetical protein